MNNCLQYPVLDAFDSIRTSIERFVLAGINIYIILVLLHCFKTPTREEIQKLYVFVNCVS